MRELRQHEYWHDKIVDAVDPYLKNDHAAMPMIIENISQFLAISTRGGQDTETDNAIRAAAAPRWAPTHRLTTTMTCSSSCGATTRLKSSGRMLSTRTFI
eukprot:m.39168 g.39168  ORF g.39168 m.39168 type:complete len:100 (-) comp13581_c0_seq1:373-672(-)